jgi:predicted nucleotidyltransferase
MSDTAIVGIIAEYNPLHTGHHYHINEARSLTGADSVVVVLSGPFTQRGDPALFSPAARAETALLCGADMVFELPAVYAVREAEHFALGGVSLLHKLGCTHIAFGCETPDMELFTHALNLLSDPSNTFKYRLRLALARGCSLARARGEALRDCLKTDALMLPNNILALCYMSAVRQLELPMTPVLIERKGSYHHAIQPDSAVFPSSTALRHAILSGNWPGIRHMTPQKTYPVIIREMTHGRIHPPEGLDNALRAKLLYASHSMLHALPGVDEGLDRLIKKHLEHALSREALLAAMKSKRYTRTRISRLLTHLLLELTAEQLESAPRYARLLALRTSASHHIRKLKQGGVTIIEKAADYTRTDPSFIIDMRAYDLWALGAGLPFGEGWRQSPVIDPNEPNGYNNTIIVSERN